MVSDIQAHWGKISYFCSKNSHFKTSFFFFDKIRVFHKIHIFKVSFFTKLSFEKSKFLVISGYFFFLFPSVWQSCLSHVSPENVDYRLTFLGSQKQNYQTCLLFLFSVCGRTYQETKATFGSPQQASYTTTPGIEPQPYRMVNKTLTHTGAKILDLSENSHFENLIF